ncbi:hypothetical protein OsJ_34693 [Oryza sativa Japonica Group]|uniref:Uncharacterized protein n=1 Tax=Oryza sativa subsp. japonica TaxID=39947 RepID=B9G8N1_ORYSJ|nr:hypothetical protein OsJ_34693 [Oryza sativa Japonica Group]
MADLALSTVHALLGVIRKEAELLGRVRRDVQFIRDEMESINGLLRHLAGTKERASDHQVRAWIKAGHGACLRLQQLRRELKVRAREVGERQQRYGVAVPAKKDGAAAAGGRRDNKRPWIPRAAPAGCPEAAMLPATTRAIVSECRTDHMLKECTDELINWFDMGVAPDGRSGVELKRPKLSVAVIVALDAADGAIVVDKVYRHYKPMLQPPSSGSGTPVTAAATSPFKCRLSVTFRRPTNLMEVLMDMLRQLQSEGCVESMGDDVQTWDLDTLKEKIKNSLRGKRLLLFLTNADYLDIWFPIEEDDGDNKRPLEYSSMPRKVAGGGDASRRRAAAIVSECGTDHMLKECTDELINWVDMGVAPDGRSGVELKRPKLSVAVIVAPDAADGAIVVDKVYRHYKPMLQPPSSGSGTPVTAAATSPFKCRLSVTLRRPTNLMEVLMDMLRQLQSEGCVESMGDDVQTWDLDTLKEKIKNSLRGKRLLLFLTNADYLDIWFPIEEVLASTDCDHGSAVVLSSKDREVANKLMPPLMNTSTISDNMNNGSASAAAAAAVEVEVEEDKDLESNNSKSKSKSKLPLMKTVSYSHVDFHYKKANQLMLQLTSSYNTSDAVKQVLTRCDTDDFCAKVFLHALHNNPNRTADELKILTENLAPDRCSNDPLEKRVRLAAFCYYGLPDRYKNCLWYAAAFIRGSYDIRRASLTRRWIAEGLIIRSGQPTEQEEAERCVDTLLSLNLLIPKERERGVIEGKVKTCSVNTPVIDIVNGSRSISASTVDDFLDTNQLPLDLDLHFSIRNGIRIRQLDAMDGSTMEPRPPAPKKQLESVMEFLRKLPSSSRLRLLRVLDLEGCGVIITNRHLNNICQIRKLKYLSLRGTNIVWLPKKLHQLELLETLDIRQTRVCVFESTLPKSLKHLLAGRVDCLGDDAVTVKSKESFSTVRMPSGIPAGDMSKLEILSHVWVSDSAKELDNLGEKLKQLRKLGVVLCGGSKANLKDLFAQINKLHTTLRSLSIRMKPVSSWGSTEAVLMTPPLLLESLRICGVRDWLPRRMKELNNLSKLTLRDTLLNEDNLAVLGALKGLRCLRLRYHSFDSGGLTFSS